MVEVFLAVTLCVLSLQASDQRVKSLEANIEVERAAHLESKISSEVIQVTSTHKQIRTHTFQTLK